MMLKSQQIASRAAFDRAVRTLVGAEQEFSDPPGLYLKTALKSALEGVELFAPEL